MQFIHSPENTSTLQSLSARLRQCCSSQSIRRHLSAPFTKVENRRHNVSFVLAQIIVQCQLADRSETALARIIETYNLDNGTGLSIAAYKQMGWIRLVNNEALMPVAVKQLMVHIRSAESQGQKPVIPVDKIHPVRCLLVYYTRSFRDSRPFITAELLDTILHEHASPGLTISYFVDNNLLRYDEQTQTYLLHGGTQDIDFNNEVAAMLWMLTAIPVVSIEQFRLWYRRIAASTLFVTDLSRYLNNKQLSDITRMAIEMLQEEEDLLASPMEFTRIWLDSEQYRHIDVTAEVPAVDLNSSSVWNYIDDLQYQQQWFYDLFDYQRTRSFSYLLIRLVIMHAHREHQPFEEVIGIAREITRPFLVWTCFKEIPRNYPWVIPYLLTDHDLAPLVFQQIDKTEIDNSTLFANRPFEQHMEDSWKLKNEWWLEMFGLLLDQLDYQSLAMPATGELLARILLRAAQDTFYFGSGRDRDIKHNCKKNRYDQAWKIFSDKRINDQHVYSGPSIRPRIYFLLVPQMVAYLQLWYASQRTGRTESLTLANGLLDACIEILRLSVHIPSENEIPAADLLRFNDSITQLGTLITTQLQHFYTASTLMVATFDASLSEQRSVRRDNLEFGFEIIDWGLLYLKLYHAGFLPRVAESFKLNHELRPATHRYDDDNREQIQKITAWLKSLMIGFIAIHENKTYYQANGLPADQCLQVLENDIVSCALDFCVEDTTRGRVNVFDEIGYTLGETQYYQPMIKWLFRCVNLFEHNSPLAFTKNFFDRSINIGLMLSAINTVQEPALVELVSGHILAVDVEAFIKSCSTVTDLQHALIDAVNSKEHWSLAKPFIERIQRHYAKRKYNEEDIAEFLFEINLLLHFKEHDLLAIESLPLPPNKNNQTARRDWAENTKTYYRALHYLYTENYKAAIDILAILLSSKENNLRYAFYLYQAQMLQAIKGSPIDRNLVIRARQEWEDRVSKPARTQENVLTDLSEHLDSTNLQYYIIFQDEVNADRTLARLSKPFLYDEQIIPLIYHYYVSRQLHQLAYNYIVEAQQYLRQQGNVPVAIEQLVLQAETPAVLKQLKQGFSQVLTLQPASVVQVSPEIINDKKNLDDFILHEFLLASEILRDKIQAVKQAKLEDPFTDLLLASLRLRFPFWGWNITGQERTGASPTGKSAGEVDITITAAGKTIAIAEALVLKGQDATKTAAHVRKCFDYNNHLPRYFLIIYFTGPPRNFAKTWGTYKQDVLATSFPTGAAIDRVKQFEDLAKDFSCFHNIFLAKTTHGKDIHMFHLMINLQ